MAAERQELSCTECGRYIQFDMDFEHDGQHEIACPICDHLHYRIVRNGKITGDRYQPFGKVCYTVANVTWSWSSTDSTTTSSSIHLASAWADSGTGSWR